MDVVCILCLCPPFPLNCSSSHPKWESIKFGVSYLTTVEMTLSKLISQLCHCQMIVQVFSIWKHIFEDHCRSTAEWYLGQHSSFRGLPRWLSGKESASVQETPIQSVLGRSPGGGHGNPLQYPYLENPMDRGAWRAWLKWINSSSSLFRNLFPRARQNSSGFHSEVYL